MSDRYQSAVQTALGQAVAQRLGLPQPTVLDRWTGGSPVVTGTVVLGGTAGGRLANAIEHQLTSLGVAFQRTLPDGEQAKGLVFDASAVQEVDDLAALAEFFRPLLRRLAPSGRTLVVGTPPEHADSPAHAVVQRALEGFTRSLGKELRRGATAQLLYVAPGAETALSSTLGFLLSPRSAYVSGQVVRVGTAASRSAVTRTADTPGGTPAVQPPAFDPAAPLRGRVVLVTGASQGIGAATARVLHRDGATVVGLDVPARASELMALTAEISGDYLALDVTTPDAAPRIAQRLVDRHAGVDVVVHNAGITRDRRLANMTRSEWDPVMAVNLAAPLRITEHLLDEGVIRAGGAVVCVSSIAGIAGNDGQTNYATSKAGVIGLVEALAPLAAAKEVTVNAVAPGVIETQMTAAMPPVVRELGRRMNSLAQGGQPVDVAEAVAWYASAASAAVTGNVLRVCGQSLIGA
jgi:3-oxoacyl-[acyl-carrier protein] reductase